MSTVVPPRTRRGRWPEITLLLLAGAIGVGAYYLVWTGLDNTGADTTGLPPSFALVVGASAALVFACHLLIRALCPYADPVLFPCAIALNGLGLAMIYRVDAAADTDHARSQLILTAGALVFFAITILAMRNYRVLQNYMWTSLIAGVVLLLLPLSPLGRTLNGSRLWIGVGGMSFQPAEVAKICFAVFFAAYLVTERDNLALAGPKILGIRLPKARHILPLLIAWALCMSVLVFERDFGTALLFFGLFVAMLWVATEQVSWLAIGALLTVGGVWFISTTVSHVQARFAIWLDPFDPELYDAVGGSYQVVQGLFGMASGGLFGAGLGRGYPNLVYAAHSDFIYASFAEELGLVGVGAILCIYLLLISRGMRVALESRDGFGKLLASGLSFVLGLQCFIVIGGVTRIIPLTGLALPFLAHGGSALLTNWIIIALLIRMSHTARRPEEARPLPTTDELAVLRGSADEGDSEGDDDARRAPRGAGRPAGGVRSAGTANSPSGDSRNSTPGGARTEVVRP
ncbi:FtsW/RodA/SpoVE family cell cycle protein [Actinotignum timonense]|uniref:FtsW/RodA/SpoVE family cell cycle protein n=1 Tax=Actinotignum timonense TaxID=1870995 RepID=UPI00254D431C|nr:FtsW/RodA/SpoVE family cell cycle protein [Actinotignum timonense]